MTVMALFHRPQRPIGLTYSGSGRAIDPLSQLNPSEKRLARARKNAGLFVARKLYLLEQRQDKMEGTEDMELLAHFGRRPSSTLPGRRARETRPLSRVDRQSISTHSIKNCQFNMKVTPEFRERVSALARNEKISMVELVERAVETYARLQGQARCVGYSAAWQSFCAAESLV
jgi:hypothetical protein